jgi:non-specific serine/threonine protein kinase
MDAVTADDLIRTAEAGRALTRRGEEAAGIAQIEARYMEIREALDWLPGEGRAGDAFRLATALVPFWLATKRIDEADAWYGWALATPDGSVGAPASRRARALHDHGYLVFFAGRYDVAERRFAESRQVAEEAGDANLVALALAGSARVVLNTDPVEAVRLLRRAYEVTEHLADSDGRSSAEHVLGVALQMSGDLQGARTVMAERLERARAGGNAYVVAMESSNLSMVERRLGNLDQAAHLSLDALRITRDGADEMAIPWILNGLAAVTAAQGRAERAAKLLAIAECLLERAGGEWPPDEREQHDGALATVSEAISAAQLEASRSEARTMTVADAVEFALAGARTTEPG